MNSFYTRQYASCYALFVIVLMSYLSVASHISTIVVVVIAPAQSEGFGKWLNIYGPALTTVSGGLGRLVGAGLAGWGGMGSGWLGWDGAGQGWLDGMGWGGAGWKW